ncbi:MAG: methyltransferase domain-containing protein [Chitinophagales bacterium]|nr:methyltransferase domain-containing protein [Chitinophagales bacterium]
MKKTLKWKIAQSLEIKWWKRYLSDKNPEKYLKWKKNYWKQVLQEIGVSDEIKDKNILDAGCGPAGIFMAFENASSVKAIDPLLDKYTDLPHFRPRSYPNVGFEKMPLELLDGQMKYDMVFCMNAINHVSDIHLAYDKLCDVVKAHGTLVVSIDAHNHPILKKIFRALPGDALHPHQYDLKEYEQFLIERGFKIKTSFLKTHGRIFDYYILVAENT